MAEARWITSWFDDKQDEQRQGRGKLPASRVPFHQMFKNSLQNTTGIRQNVFNSLQLLLREF